MLRMIRALALGLTFVIAMGAQAQQSDTPPPQPSAPATASTPIGHVYSMSDTGVIAPVPIYRPKAKFTDKERKGKYHGDVQVSCIVGPDGLVQSVQVIQDPGMGLGEKAVEAVKQWRFKPAMKDGKPVAVSFTMEISFTVN